ncbi:MAG: GNAT family N-acetyltransferase [Candidatus Gracilibacteria bacterium]|jgi:GNAT superfamily N-acetyltransferase
MKKEIKLVPLKKTDFDQVILLLKQLWPNKKINETNVKTTLLKQLKDKKRHLILMIKCYKETIGMITISWRLNLDVEGLLGSIDEFIIDEKYRGMGIGTGVIKKAIEICKKRKTKGVTILSALHRKEAHNFYIKNGVPKTCYAFEKSFN